MGVRGVAIEQAWAWLRFQPESELSKWYQKRFGGAPTPTRIEGRAGINLPHSPGSGQMTTVVPRRENEM